MRSRLALVTACVAAVLLVGGCGLGGGGSEDDAVTIDHTYGSTQISGTPQRVVALSATDADTAAALGVTPVIIAQAPGTERGGQTPWFTQRTAGAPVDVIQVAGGDQGGQIPFERIAAANPDLILGTASGVSARDYETLSGIAPTLAPKLGNFLDAWPDITRTVGTALGRTAEAEQIVTETQGRIAAAAAEHPEFRGRTFVGSLLISEAQFGVLVDSRESTVSLMRGLGFTLKPEVDNLPSAGFSAQVSRERAGLLDADVTLAYAPKPEVTDFYLADPLVQSLDVVQRGAFIRVDRLLWGAFRNPSVLSIPYALDKIVPQLAAARPAAP